MNKLSNQDGRVQRRTTGYNNKKVRAHSLSKGDLVLKRTNGGNLDPKWEGPYVVDAEVAPGAYKLKNNEGEVLGKTWNADRLKKFYP